MPASSAQVEIKGMQMIRSELIQKIADENPHLFQRDVDRIVSTIFDEISEQRTCKDAGVPEIYCACRRTTATLQYPALG